MFIRAISPEVQAVVIWYQKQVSISEKKLNGLELQPDRQFSSFRASNPEIEELFADQKFRSRRTLNLQRCEIVGGEVQRDNNARLNQQPVCLSFLPLFLFFKIQQDRKLVTLVTIRHWIKLSGHTNWNALESSYLVTLTSQGPAGHKFKVLCVQ